MYKFLLKFTALLLILVGVASSCNPEPENEYPKDISFTEYALLDTDCQWTNLPYDDTVMIINSSKELNKYISCEDGSSIPPVDFSKYSLLLINGKTNREIDEITIKKLKQLSADAYTLKIEIVLIPAAIYEKFPQYTKALLVEKMSNESRVELMATFKDLKVILPVSVTDEKILQFFYYAIPPTAEMSNNYFFEGIPRDKDTCLMFNSKYELEQACTFPNFLPDIDFENYTLTIGKQGEGVRLGSHVIDQKIFENNVLTLLVNSRTVGGPASAGILYYWGIYPKLPNKPFYVEFKILKP